MSKKQANPYPDKNIMKPKYPPGPPIKCIANGNIENEIRKRIEEFKKVCNEYFDTMRKLANDFEEIASGDVMFLKALEKLNKARKSAQIFSQRLSASAREKKNIE